jgi:hypothetical protein
MIKSRSVGSEGSAVLLVVYDLRDPIAWQAARRHRALWRKLYTDIHALDSVCPVPITPEGPPREPRR